MPLFAFLIAFVLKFKLPDVNVIAKLLKNFYLHGVSFSIPSLLPVLCISSEVNLFLVAHRCIFFYPVTVCILIGASRILAWKIPWMAGPGRLQSMEL